MDYARPLFAVSAAALFSGTAALAHDCAAVAEDARRLLCYDAAFGRSPATSAKAPQPPVAAPVSATSAGAGGSAVNRQLLREAGTSRTLATSWDLDPADPRGIQRPR